MVVPTPMPRPPGVEGLCPIIVDSVMIVSVMVSIATSPITGAASLMRMESRSSMRRPAAPRALVRDWNRPRMLALVPLMPVVGTMALDRKRTCSGAGPTSASATSVVALPMSIPAISFTIVPLPVTCFVPAQSSRSRPRAS